MRIIFVVAIMLGLFQGLARASVSSQPPDLSSQQIQSSITLKFRPFNRVTDARRVTLLDLLDRDLLDSKTQKVLSQIELGDAPRLGEQRVYSSNVIAEALRTHFSSNKLDVQIPRKVIVQNRGYEFDEESLKSELLAAWKTHCQDCRIRIKELSMPQLSQNLKDRPWRFEAITRLPRGHFSHKILVSSIDGRDAVFWVNGEAEIEKKVPVLNRSTPIQARLQKDDFKMEWRDVTMATDTNPTAEEIIGQMARFTMNANDIIWRNSLMREKAVRRGEIVKVVIGDEQWQVTTQAMTQQDGYIGDTISLKNIQTQKMITGRVIGEGEVEIR